MGTKPGAKSLGGEGEVQDRWLSVELRGKKLSEACGKRIKRSLRACPQEEIMEFGLIEGQI